MSRDEIGKRHGQGSFVTAVVIPCFEEAARLDLKALARAITSHDEWSFVFVDDGSTDATPHLLDGLKAERPERVSVLRLPRNLGKAEAVRHGMRAALENDVEIVAYADADLSTPLSELARLIERVSANPEINAVLGSRFRRLGADVRRSLTRHLIGRVYATVASLALQAPVYDTQCGAKAFRRTPQLEAALGHPFKERWAFDVELLSRLTRGCDVGGEPWSAIVEEPLETWHARSGSKLTAIQALRAGLELLVIGRRHRNGHPDGTRS